MCNRELPSKQLNKIKNRIQKAARSAHRDPSEIRLIGASKQKNSVLLHGFYEAGLTQFGENYLQEALNKQQELRLAKIDWHFIGQLQSKKCKAIAQNFNWVHTVDRFKIAQRLAKFRAESEALHHQPLNILLQINIDQEASKAGSSIDSVPALCDKISQLDGVQLRGFMLIPKPYSELISQRRPFALARTTLETVNQRYGLTLDNLSMGMSADLEAAVIEGSTMVRVGSALFGARNLTNPNQKD